MKTARAFIKKYHLKWLLLLLLVPILYGVYYLNTAYAAMKDIQPYLESSTSVTVTEGKIIKFEPTSATGKGVIFYPGGKVKPESYVPLMRELAENGYAAYLVKMPFNLAVFNVNGAQKIIEEHDEIKDWYIGGHSLGGAMASSFASKNSELLKGIFFLGAYPVESTDLSQTTLKSLSIYGELDAFVLLDEIPNHQKLLPVDQEIHIIEGGNHSQFGYYGLQDKDNEASITREQQQKEVLRLLLEFMQP